MNPERLINIACTVRRLVEGAVDVWGEPIEAWTDTAWLCWIDLRGRTTESSETGPPTNFQIETVDIYLRAGLAVSGNDKVVVGPKTYSILGPPHTFTHPRTLAEIYTHAVGREVT